MAGAGAGAGACASAGRAERRVSVKPRIVSTAEKERASVVMVMGQRFISITSSTRTLTALCDVLSLPPDRDHRFVGAPAVDAPELLELRSVEIIELQTGIADGGPELVRHHSLADGGTQRGDDRRRRAFWREDSHPQIVFDVVAELLERGYIGQLFRARGAEDGKRAQLAGPYVRQRRRDRLRRDLGIVAEDGHDGGAPARGGQMAQPQRTRRLFQISERQMARAVEAARAEDERVRVLVRGRDELAERA